MIRLAARSRFSNAVELAKLGGLRHPGSAFVADDLSRLALLSGVPEAKLRTLTYRPSHIKGEHHFLDGTIKRIHLDLSHRWVCPECLKEACYHRCLWDLRPIACCPRHRRLLLRECWQCSRALGWEDSRLDICDSCGASITNAPFSEVYACDADASQDIYDIASGRNVDWLHSALRDAPRGDIIDFVIDLGFIIARDEKHRSHLFTIHTRKGELLPVITAGICCLRDWPLPFAKMIEQRLELCIARRLSAGAQKTFGKLYNLMAKLPDTILREAVLNVARDVVRQNPLTRGRMHRSVLLGLGLDDENTTSLTEAARTLESSSAHVKRLVKAGVLTTLTKNESRGVPTLYERRVLDEFAAKIDRHLNLREASRRLSISKARMLELIKAGLIKPDHRASQDGLGVWAIDSNDVDKFVAEIEARCQLSVNGSRMDFNAAMEAFRRRGKSLPDVLTMVIEGGLDPVCSSPYDKGLTRFHFSRDEVKRQCRELETSAGSLSRQATAEILRCKWEVVQHLIQVGLLRAEGDRLPVKEVYRFKREIVSASELAHSISVSPLTLLSRAQKEGVDPVSGPDVDGGRQVFFRRTPALLGVSDLIMQQK